MKSFLRSRDAASKGAALMIVLAFVVLLTGVALAYFSRTTTDRQLAQSSYNDTSADLLARSALDIIISDFKRDIVVGQPITSTNIEPTRNTPTPPPSATATPIPNLIRQSFLGDISGRTSAVNSSAVSANNRSISTARWNSHYLIPRGSPNPNPASSPVANFSAPDWVLVTAQGPRVTPSPSAVIGRYALAVYDEGGLLDMNLAGYPTASSGGGGGGPSPSPTPWAINIGRKGILGFADLTALPTPPSTGLINQIVGWRNFVNTGQSDGNFGNFSPLNNLHKQDKFGRYLLDFGDPPYSSPSPFPTYPFTSVDTTVSTLRTDQALITRQQLLKLQSSLSSPPYNLNFSPDLLQYMGTFSRERNQPARDWNRLNGHLPDRFDVTNLGLVKPNPTGTPNPKGKGKGVGRGRYKGDAVSILDFFGLAWVAPDTSITDPQQLNYWGHWRYIGRPGFACNPNGHGCEHIPALRGGRNDFFQILDYAVKGQANGTNDDTVYIETILGLGASLIDQYDTPDLDVDTSAPAARQTHTTIIEYDRFGTAGYVLGWENGDTIDPHASTALNKPTPTPGPSPIVLNHAFTTAADFGYGLKTVESFTPLDLHTSGSNESALLDFFTYNPVDHQYPRLGIVNLNTRNVPVLAAILKSALKRDVDATPTPNPLPTVTQSEAMNAAQAIVNETSASGRAAINRGDISRLTSVAASWITNPGYTGEELQKLPETIARALAEITQARTWTLMIDVIAQTGNYKPNAPDLSGGNFVVQGEKRYWLHIALGRDLVSGTVDVLGTQLEEVIE
jgi:hypothetical protein